MFLVIECMLITSQVANFSGINKYIVAEEAYLRELQNQQDLKKDNLDYSTNNF